MSEAYAATAEFYDLLQATEYLALAERLIDRWLGVPQLGVLDVGAGTGVATALLAGRFNATVHAIEPATNMRAVLLSRLAGHADLLERVRVHARPAQHLALRQAADAAICLNMMSGLAGDERAEVLDALALALVAESTLVIQAPPTQPGPPFAALPSWRLGGDIYGGDVTCVVTGPGRLLWRFAYRVSRADVIIREETETFPGYIIERDEFTAELAAAGFVVVDTDQPDVLIVRRIR